MLQVGKVIMYIELNLVQYEYKLKISKMVKNDPICNKFWVIIGLVDKMDNILYLMCIELNLVQYEYKLKIIWK